MHEHISRKIGLDFPGTGIDRIGGNLRIENAIALCANESKEAVFFMGFAAKYVPQGCVRHLVIDHMKIL